MFLDRKILGELLKQAGVDEKALGEALEASQSFERPLENIVIQKGLIGEKKLGTLIAGYLKVPFVWLKDITIPGEVLDLVPEETAVSSRLIPFKKEGNELWVAATDPKNFEALDFVRKKTGFLVRPFYALEGDLGEALGQYKRDIHQAFEKILKETVSQAPPTGRLTEGKELAKAALELPIIKALDTILEYALASRASDVHLEGVEERLVLRFRIDGILRDILTLPKNFLQALVARIKILSSLKIDEHRIPQDGRFKFSFHGTEIALRVSIMPAFYGENVVMRLLLESAKPLSLQELGLTNKNLEIIEKNIKKTHGMILVTGPTGSGKTTTLYSILNILNSPETKLCTVEDPIEYGIPRITQIQINLQTGLTFASGLRSLLRHDPDIVMVGEIRDRETADIAIHSALTGHLVLSTLHTNDAPSAIPRFLDLGAEPFLVASTVNVVMAQRLVRKLCATCRKPFVPSAELIGELVQLSDGLITAEALKPNFFQGQGCSECKNSGYSGRIAVYEVFEITEEIHEMILKKESADRLKQKALEKGMTTMIYDGIQKAKQGLTSLEEILRVTRE